MSNASSRKRAKTTPDEERTPAQLAANDKQRQRRAAKARVNSTFVNGFTNTLSVSGLSFNSTTERVVATRTTIEVPLPAILPFIQAVSDRDWNIEVLSLSPIDYGGVPLVTSTAPTEPPHAPGVQVWLYYVPPYVMQLTAYFRMEFLLSGEDSVMILGPNCTGSIHSGKNTTTIAFVCPVLWRTRSSINALSAFMVLLCVRSALSSLTRGFRSTW
jgi:hypothetical protein